MKKIYSFQYFKAVAAQSTMGVSALFFLVDAIMDVNEHLSKNVSYSHGELAHLVLELIAVIALSLGFLENAKKLKRLEKEHEAQANCLHYLKRDFEALIRSKFLEWALTPAEIDTAMLMLKGLKNEEIARIRNVKIGTVKVQSHTALNKAGLKSRNELMAFFMDEFIDLGMNDIEHRQPD